MPDQTPEPFNYHTPDPGPPPASPPQFLLALVIGILISLAYWTWVFRSANLGPATALSLLTAKLLVGQLLRSTPRYRSAGSGLHLSILVGLLIFLGTCSAEL